MNPPRPRAGKNRNLPDNLYPNGKYWQYRNPITGKKVSINKPMAEAIKLAKLANAKLAPLMTDGGATAAGLLRRHAAEFEGVQRRLQINQYR